MFNKLVYTNGEEKKNVQTAHLFKLYQTFCASANAMNIMDFKKLQKAPMPGIEPGSPG